MTTVPAGPGDRAARAVQLAALAAFLAVTGWIFARTIVLAPYSDALDLLARYLDTREHSGDLAAYLFNPHNFHRPAVLFGVLGLDAMAHADGWILVAAGGLSLAGAAAILAWSASGAAPGLRLEGAVLAAMLVLLPGNLLGAAIHLNTLYVHTLVFAVAALAAAEPDAGQPLSWRRRALTLAAAIVASFSSGVGLVLWPVLLLGALRRRESFVWLALLLAAAALVIGIYALGVGSGRGAGVSFDLAGAVRYGLSILGLPWGRIAPSLSWLIGGIVLLAALAAVLLRGRRDAPRAERLAVAFILFSLGAAAMIALGRTDIADAADTPVRYATYLTPLHVGLLMIALPLVAGWPFARPALALAAVLLLAQQAVMGMAAVRTTDINRALIADFRAGLRTPAMVPTVHTDLQHAAAIYARLEAAGLYRRQAGPTGQEGP